MATDDDVYDMLEAPYEESKEELKKPETVDDNSKSPKRSSRSKSKENRGSQEKSAHRSHSHERRRSRSKDRRSSRRSRSPRDRRRSDRSRSRDRRRGDDKRRRSRSKERRPPSPYEGGTRRGHSPAPKMTEEERDAHTIFVMQLSRKIRDRDLKEFFSSVGKVREVRLIADNKTGKSKGIAYVEFIDKASVNLAVELNQEKLLGVPIMIQPSSELGKNGRAGRPNQKLANQQAAIAAGVKETATPLKMYIGNLHQNINEDMLKTMFEPFGKVQAVNVIYDDTNVSKGYGFVTFFSSEDALKAMAHMNGLEIAGRNIKVAHINDNVKAIASAPVIAPDEGMGLDTDDHDRRGIEMTTTGRLQLMARLAEGTGLQLPRSAQSVLGTTNVMGLAAPPPPPPESVDAPPIATPAIMLSNMFNPDEETEEGWVAEITEDVITECYKYGGVRHVFVDEASKEGNVYVKCASIAAAQCLVKALHGRYFASRLVQTAYVPLPSYHDLFPQSLKSQELLIPKSLQKG